MNITKAILVGCFMSFCPKALFAQDSTPLYQKTQIFVNAGLSKPFLNSGKELLRGKTLRENNESYFLNSNGERRDVGSFSNQFGWNLGIGFYKPMTKFNHLMWGTEVNMNLTGSTPSAGFEEAYFFNYISMNLGLKYYALKHNFVKVNAGVSSVMTKNRFINEVGNQSFFHQFGIGYNIQTSLGYNLPINNSKLSALEFELEFQYSSVRVEVNNIGNDQWEHTALAAKIGVLF